MKHLPKFLTMITVGLLVATTVKSEIQPKWTAQFESKIQWQRTTRLGYLVVNTKNALYGVNEETGEIKWKFEEMRNLEEDAYRELERLPFIAIEFAEPGVLGDNAIAIIDPEDGRLVLHSKKAGIRFSDHNEDVIFLPQNGAVLITAFNLTDKKNALHCFDLATGELLWKNKEDKSVVRAALEINDTEFIGANIWDAYHIDTRTGKVNWKIPVVKDAVKMGGKLGGFMKSLGDAVASQAGDELDIRLLRGQNDDVFYLAYESKETDTQGEEYTASNYRALQVKDGKDVWKDVYSYTGNLGLYAYHETGLIILPQAEAKTVINKLAYDTGTPLWGKKGKGIKTKGSVLDYSFTPEGMLLTNGKFSGNGKKVKGLMNLLDVSTGLFKYKKFQKVNGRVLYNEVTSAGLVYVTEKEVNILDLTTGDELLDKSIATDPGLQAISGDILYVFSDKGELHEVNKATAKAKVISQAAVEFEGKDDPSALEVRGDGVLLSADQNYALYDFNGALKYQVFYPAPREGGWMRAYQYAKAAAGATAMIGGAIYTTAAGAMSVAGASYGADVSSGVDATNTLASFTGSSAKFMANSLKRANARLENTKSTRDFAFVVNNDPGAGFRLIQIDKANGEVKEQIGMDRDRKPSYEIDNVINQVYYQYSDDAIACYAFN